MNTKRINRIRSAVIYTKLKNLTTVLPFNCKKTVTTNTKNNNKINCNQQSKLKCKIGKAEYLKN